MPWFLSAIGESIRLRTLKGKPERAIRCLHVPRTAYNRSHVNFAPPAHPSAGAIGASLVVNCRAINSRRPALETFQRIDLIDFVDEPLPRRPSAPQPPVRPRVLAPPLSARPYGAARPGTGSSTSRRTAPNVRTGPEYGGKVISSHCAPGINWKLRFRPLCM